MKAKGFVYDPNLKPDRYKYNVHHRVDIEDVTYLHQTSGMPFYIVRQFIRDEKSIWNRLSVLDKSNGHLEY